MTSSSRSLVNEDKRLRVGGRSVTLKSSLKYNTIFLGGFPDDDFDGYDKMVSGRRKTGRVSHLLVTRPCF